MAHDKSERKQENEMSIKLLIGGSPCTHWSIAQKNNRETEPSGEGWELFKNFLIAREKFKPDFFLYENNKSASKAIKDQIAYEFGVGVDEDVRFTYINSALVSAQNRQRFYVTNFGVIQQLEDRGILLKDILESGVVEKEKSYCLCTDHVGTTRDYFKKSQSQIVFEPIPINPLESEKSRALTASYANKGVKHIIDSNASPNPSKQQWDCVAEPIRIGDIGSTAQAHRVYSCYGKSVTLSANGGGQGGKTGLYLVPVPEELKKLVCDKGKIYEVVNGKIDTKFGEFEVNLPDGYYLIRKLTVKECCRLQTMPDDYCKAVSPTQAYKGLGNGWTAEVIIHLLNHALKDVPRDEEIIVLSMYDGIGTGRYCLDKMGFTNVKYYAYEIDKYPIMIAMDNYPDIIQCGDAFAVREDSWRLPG
jgi:DNA (cytosine-5)-methyltransferase 3A